jgi:hypothetical protein
MAKWRILFCRVVSVSHTVVVLVRGWWFRRDDHLCPRGVICASSNSIRLTWWCSTPPAYMHESACLVSREFSTHTLSGRDNVGWTTPCRACVLILSATAPEGPGF